MPPRGLRLANEHLHKRMKKLEEEYFKEFGNYDNYTKMIQENNYQLFSHAYEIMFAMNSGELSFEDLFEMIYSGKPLDIINSSIVDYCIEYMKNENDESVDIVVELFKKMEAQLNSYPPYDYSRISREKYNIIKKNVMRMKFDFDERYVYTSKDKARQLIKEKERKE